MKKGEKLEVAKLKKPDFMTDPEWEATKATLTMLNENVPQEVFDNVGDKVTSLDRIKSDAAADTDGFKSTKGADFNEVGAPPTLLLTTIGRKSGREITTPVNYIQDGDNYVVVASLAGFDVLPHWYLNLDKNPKVWVEPKDEKIAGTARTANREEKAALWPRLLTEGQPFWAYFQMFTDREFPAVIITPNK